MQESVSSYTSDGNYKKERRDIDKQLLKLIQQVSGTQEQVGTANQSSHNLVTLSIHLLSQLSVPAASLICHVRQKVFRPLNSVWLY